MELQSEWIERIFARLAAYYGAAFGRQWEGTNLAEVKSAWAESLGGFTGEQFGDALESCKSREYPPNMPEFLNLCRASAKRTDKPRAIEAPRLSVEERMERAQQLEASSVKTSSYDYRGWAKELKRRYLSGEHLLIMQEDMASEALNEVWEKRECHPRMEPA